MSEIKYKDVNDYLAGVNENAFAPVYLIYGEEYLYKTAFDALLEKMVPGAKKSFGYEPVDAENESISELVERLNTFSLMSGRKVVSLCDSKIFYSKNDEAAILTRAKNAFDDDDKAKASKFLTSLLSFTGLDFESALTVKGKKSLKYAEVFGDDDSWLKELIGYCRDNNIEIPESADSAKILKEAVEKGFPDDHHLIITADLIDKRKSLFTAIKKHGAVIDCSVPKGDRKADKDQQAVVLRENTMAILSKTGKQIDPEAYRYLCEMTGFDLRAFTGNLEKLVSFTGRNTRITISDAKALLRRTKQDPIYELSGAVAEKNPEKMLYYTGNLLKNSVFPLQILATIVNQIRRLLIAKDFILNLPKGTWRRGMDYNSFRTTMMPLVKEYDARIKQKAEDREKRLADPDSQGKKGKQKKVATDIVLAKNPNSPYPVFLLIKNSERYTMDQLLAALEILKNADTRLKSTGEDPKLVLDDTLIQLGR